MYHSFLIIISQLNRRKKARIIYEDMELLIEESSNKKFWIFSCYVYQSTEHIPMSLHQCVFSCGVLQWQDFGPYLKINPDQKGIKLISQINVPDSFITFRKVVKNFVCIAKEWRETLLELCRNESPLSLKTV